MSKLTPKEVDQIVSDIIEVMVGTDSDLPEEFHQLPRLEQLRVQTDIHQCESCGFWFEIDEVDDDGVCISCRK